MSRFVALQNSQAVDFYDLPTVSSDNYKRKRFDNPWVKKYVVPSECLMEVTKENRMQFFMRTCPICGGKISGRPSEYPFYRKEGNKYIFLCGWCASLKNIKVDYGAEMIKDHIVRSLRREKRKNNEERKHQD